MSKLPKMLAGGNVLRRQFVLFGQAQKEKRPIHESAFIQHFVQIAAPGVDHIIAGLSTELEPHWPALLRDLFARHPRALMARTADDNGNTLIHGDVGEANVLVPHLGSRPLYIIDRQPFDWCLTTWLGAYDLVYAKLDWPVETRRRLEEPVLHQYHQSLQANGVRDYSWADLRNDYRLMIPMAVYLVVEYCRSGFNVEKKQYWLPMLRRALSACIDHQCHELWLV